MPRESVAKVMTNALFHYTQVRHIFCVPGAPLVATLDAIEESQDFDLINSATEIGMAHSVHGYAQKEGIAIGIVTQGVGISAGGSLLCHLTSQHPAAVILLVGQCEEEKIGQPQIFQSINTDKALCGIAKKIFRIRKNSNPIEVIKKAVEVARSGVPGAVAIELPVDVMSLEIPKAKKYPNMVVKEAVLSYLEKLSVQKIQQAKKTVFIIGDQYAAERIHKPFISGLLQYAVEKVGVAVAATHGQGDQFPNSHKYYVGSFGYNRIVENARILHEFDLPVLLGALPDGNLAALKARGDDVFWQEKAFILVHPDQNILQHYQSIFPKMIAVCSEIKPFLEYIVSEIDEGWRMSDQSLTDLHFDALEAMDESLYVGGPDLRLVSQVVEEACSGKHVLHVFDAGDAATAVCYGLKYEVPGSCVASSSAYVGYGIGAALGLSAASRDEEAYVIAHIGDSGFKYTGFEIETAKMHAFPMIVIVYNNYEYGAINRSMKKSGFEEEAGEVSKLYQSNYAKIAKAIGVDGIKVNAIALEEIEQAMKKAFVNFKKGISTIIDIDISKAKLA